MTNVDARIICFMTPGSNSHSQNAYKNLLFLLFSRTTLYTHIHTLYSTIISFAVCQVQCAAMRRGEFLMEEKVPSWCLLFSWDLWGAKSVTVQ